VASGVLRIVLGLDMSGSLPAPGACGNVAVEQPTKERQLYPAAGSDESTRLEGQDHKGE